MSLQNQANLSESINFYSRWIYQKTYIETKFCDDPLVFPVGKYQFKVKGDIDKQYRAVMG